MFLLSSLLNVVSPFAALLNTIRLEHGLRQNELADLIGYEQTYISAIEVGAKGPPTKEFADSLIKAFDLSEERQRQLFEALEASERKMILDSEMPEEIYWLFRDFKKHIHDLSSIQVQLIKQILTLHETIHKKPMSANRIKRRRFNSNSSQSE
jgi:transcriptional regulator with XRE-family HTH domain